MNEILELKEILKKAKSAYRAEKYLEAAEYYKAAEQSYLYLDDKSSAAEMANNRSVCLLQANDPSGALQAVENTSEVFLALGELKNQALAIGNRASALQALKRHDEAIADYEKAVDLLKQLGEKDLYAETMKAYSLSLLSSGRQLEAAAVLQAGVENITKPGLKEWFTKKLLSIPMDMLKKSIPKQDE